MSIFITICEILTTFIFICIVVDSNYAMHCKEQYQCDSNHMTAPENEEVQIYCESDHSCQYALIDGTAALELTVFCDAEYSCQGASIHCPEFGKCYVYCHAKYSCAYATIHGPVLFIFYLLFSFLFMFCLN